MHTLLATEARSHACKMGQMTNWATGKHHQSIHCACVLVWSMFLAWSEIHYTTETPWTLQDQGDEMDQIVQRSNCTSKCVTSPEAKECVNIHLLNKHCNSHKPSVPSDHDTAMMVLLDICSKLCCLFACHFCNFVIKDNVQPVCRVWKVLCVSAGF